MALAGRLGRQYPNISKFRLRIAFLSLAWEKIWLFSLFVFLLNYSLCAFLCFRQHEAVTNRRHSRKSLQLCGQSEFLVMPKHGWAYGPRSGWVPWTRGSTAVWPGTYWVTQCPAPTWRSTRPPVQPFPPSQPSCYWLQLWRELISETGE